MPCHMARRHYEICPMGQLTLERTLIPLDKDTHPTRQECFLSLSVATHVSVKGIREHDTISVLISVFVTCYILAQIDILCSPPARGVAHHNNLALDKVVAVTTKAKYYFEFM